MVHCLKSPNSQTHISQDMHSSSTLPCLNIIQHLLLPYLLYTIFLCLLYEVTTSTRSTHTIQQQQTYMYLIQQQQTCISFSKWIDYFLFPVVVCMSRQLCKTLVEGKNVYPWPKLS